MEISFRGFEGLESVAGFLDPGNCEHGNFVFNFVDCHLASTGFCLPSLTGVDVCNVLRHPSVRVVAVVLQDTCCERTL